MLVTLDDMKKNLGIELDDTTYDDFLTEQINIISEAMELYCGRKFLKKTYTQTFYRDEFPKDTVKELYLYHYPVHSIVDIDEGGDDLLGYRIVFSTGLMRLPTGFFRSDTELDITYVAGYTELPYVLKNCIYSLVGERYSKKQSGIDLSFGSDVQRVSIPGTISIDYDYTLQNNDQTTALGVILGNQINVLDQFKSERKVIGTLREGYVFS